MPPKLREFAMSLPPQIVPGETSRIDAIGPRSNVVEDILRQLDLAGVEGPASQPEALRVMVPFG